MTDGGGAETPNIAALPAIARLGTCESARGPDADRRVKLLIQFEVAGLLNFDPFERRCLMVAFGSSEPAGLRRRDERGWHDRPHGF